MRQRLRILVASGCTITIVLLLLACMSMHVHAETASDELRLMDGTVLRGTFVSGSVQSIVFRTDNGLVTYDINKVAAVIMHAATPGPTVTGNPGTGTPGIGTSGTDTPGTGTPGTGTPESPKTPRSTSVEQPVPTDAPATIDGGVRRIEQAFRAGDVKTALELTVPTRREEFGKIFQAHRNELVKIADLLATRKLVTTTGSTAEFEVTSGRRTFPVYFFRIDGVWLLSEL